MEDEIDLRKYVDVLLRHWRLIVSITVIAAFVAGLVSFLTPPTYEARAAVLMTKVRSEIVFEPKYRTILGDGAITRDIASQQKALIALVRSTTVATQVIEQLEDDLELGERSVESMLNMAQVRDQGDFIEISVKSTDPQKAAAIANAWVESYESYVNSLYSGILGSPEELRSQADAAKKGYEEKQKVWEDFVRDNRIAELNQQIADKELLYYVRSFREQFEASGSSPASAAANSLSIILLQTRAFTSLPAEHQIFGPRAFASLPSELQTELQTELQISGTRAFTSLPVELQISLDELSGINASLDDIDALISTLETRSGGTRGQSMTELKREINQLKAEWEQESAKQRELQNSRDIAWETYTTLDRKLAEAKVAAQAEDVMVRVAMDAVVPEQPVGPRRAMKIGVALVLGLIVGVFSAFGAEYFRMPGEKPRERRKKK